MSISPVVNFNNSSSSAYSPKFRTVNRSPYFTAGSDYVTNSHNKKKKSNVPKWIVGLAAAGALVAGYLVFRKPGKLKFTPEQQKALNHLVSQGDLEEKDIKIMQKIYNKDGKDFVKAAMHELASDMGYEKAIHPRLTFKKDGNSNSWAQMSYEINVSKNRLSNPKADMYASMRHELEHFHQSEMIYRAFGKEGVVQSEVDKVLFSVKNSDELCKKIFNKAYSDVSNKEINQFVADQKTALGAMFNTEMYEKLEKTLGKIKKGTPEYKEAALYRNANKEYLAVGTFLKNATKENVEKLPLETRRLLYKYYIDNLIEKNAYKEGDATRKNFKLFEEAIADKKAA